jgi:hypothetical protein
LGRKKLVRQVASSIVTSTEKKGAQNEKQSNVLGILDSCLFGSDCGMGFLMGRQKGA